MSVPTQLHVHSCATTLLVVTTVPVLMASPAMDRTASIAQVSS